MDVLFLSPGYPPEMHQFTRGLAQVGARVLGVGDSPVGSLPPALRRYLDDYLQVPAILDEDDVIRRVERWLGGRAPHRIEGNWEPVTMLAARLRARLGVPGLDVDTVDAFRDKERMKIKVAAAGLPVPRAARVRAAADVWRFADQVGFPLILKPVAGAGSADTWRADDPDGLRLALARIGHLPEAVVEEFVTGQEHTFETLCIEGEPVFTSVSTYFPNTLEARQNEWISPIILCRRDLNDPELVDGVALGHAAVKALNMGTGFTHMEWFRRPDGRVVFGEMACRAPGANMVDLMNYANDTDLFVEWARCVVHGRFQGELRRPWNAAIVFKRAQGQGRIRRVEGLDRFMARHGRWVARVDLLPVGSPRRDWRSTFLSDGNLVIRHPNAQACLDIAREAAGNIHLYAA